MHTCIRDEGHAYTVSTGEVDAGGSEVRIIMDYTKPCRKNTPNK